VVWKWYIPVKTDLFAAAFFFVFSMSSIKSFSNFFARISAFASIAIDELNGTDVDLNHTV